MCWEFDRVANNRACTQSSDPGLTRLAFGSGTRPDFFQNFARMSWVSPARVGEQVAHSLGADTFR